MTSFEMGKERGGGWNRLEGSKTRSPILMLRVPPALLKTLRGAARDRKLTPSALARHILAKALVGKGKRS
jgi:hypothetical protein